MLDGVLVFLIELQTQINARVGADLRAFAATRNWMSLLSVMPLGILFGAVHALTPGHSKTILASYVAGSGASAARGVAIASVLSFTHILSAVLIAVLALPLVVKALAGIGRAPLLEDVSRGLLGVLGLWMIMQAWRGHPHRHGEGMWVGAMAGLIPCPLTLFTMSFAMARGVPEAGLVFALAMMLGVMLTLAALAAATALLRHRLATALSDHARAMSTAGRLLEGLAGALLTGFGINEIWCR